MGGGVRRGQGILFVTMTYNQPMTILEGTAYFNIHVVQFSPVYSSIFICSQLYVNLLSYQSPHPTCH